MIGVLWEIQICVGEIMETSPAQQGGPSHHEMRGHSTRDHRPGVRHLQIAHCVMNSILSCNAALLMKIPSFHGDLPSSCSSTVSVKTSVPSMGMMQEPRLPFAHRDLDVARSEVTTQ